MATISAFDAKTRFGELLDRVARGEEVIITRHDKPIARIVPEGAPRIERGPQGRGRPASTAASDSHTHQGQGEPVES